MTTTTTRARPALLGIRHVALYARDLEAAERFWTHVMGYEVEWRPDPDNVYLHGGSDNLALHRGMPKAPVDESGQLDHIGLAVPTPEDVDAWAEHLKAHQVELHTEPKTHRDGARSFYFFGPENLLIQVIHHEPMTKR